VTEVKPIENIIPLQLEKLDRHCREWLELAGSTASIDETATERAIIEVYSWLHLPPPVIFWCQSPWQLAVMPIVVQMLILSERFKQWRGDFANQANDPVWQSLWTEINSQFNEDVGIKLKDQNTELRGPVHAAHQSNLERLWREDQHRRFSRGPRLGFWDHHSGLWENLSLTLFAAQHELVAELNVCGNSMFSRDAGHQLRSHFDEQFRTKVNGAFRLQMERQMGSLSWQDISSQLLEKMPTDKLSTLNLTAAGPAIPGIQSEAPNSAAVFLTAVGLESKIQFAAYFNWLVRNIWWGSWSVDWMPLHEFLLANFSIQPPSRYSRAEVAGWCNLARQAAAYSFFERACFVCDRPLDLKQDERGRFHCQDGPAVSFADGYQIHSWHGISVSKEIIESPQEITVETIQFERNAEVRRVMIERFGTARFLAESGAKQIQEDECGILYRKDLFNDEPIVMVKVINSTPEPDGTFKEYFLRVPPTISTAKAAVAWSFGMKQDEYTPKVET
jgi:hypothetical protein